MPLDIAQINDRLNITGDKKGSKDVIYNAVMGIGNKIFPSKQQVDNMLEVGSDLWLGAKYSASKTLENPGETLGDLATGAIASGPNLIRFIGDTIGVDTPASDKLYDQIMLSNSGNSKIATGVGDFTGAGGVASLTAKGLSKTGLQLEKIAAGTLAKNGHGDLVDNVTAMHNSTLASHAYDIPSNYPEQRLVNWYKATKSHLTGKTAHVRSKYITGAGGNSNSVLTPAGSSLTDYPIVLYADNVADKISRKHVKTIPRYADRFIKKHEGDHDLWKSTMSRQDFEYQVPAENKALVGSRAAKDPTYYGEAGEVNARAVEILEGLEMFKSGKLTRKKANYLNDVYLEELRPFLKSMATNPRYKNTEAKMLYDAIGKDTSKPMLLFDSNANAFREVAETAVDLTKRHGRDVAEATAAHLAVDSYVNKDR